MNITKQQKDSAGKFVKAQDMSALVNELVCEDGFYHPNLGGITRGGMANHFPMTIIALHGLGGTDEDITRFTNSWPRHRARIHEDLSLADSQTLNSDNWTEYLGQDQYLTEFKRVFLNELNRNDTSMEFVGHALNEMKNGLPMGLFHPVIRLSFALMHGDKGLVADALAYMGIRYFDLYGPVQTSGMQTKTEQAISEQKSPAKIHTAITASQVWQQLQANAKSIKIKGDIYGGSLHIGELLCGEADIQQRALLAEFEITPENLTTRMQQICESATGLYLQEPALTTLHGVTAAQALVDITQRAQNKNLNTEVYIALWQRYWIWLSGLYLEKGSVVSLPSLNDQQQIDLQKINWHTLSDAARKTTEVHLIKMVFTCKWLYEQLNTSDMPNGESNGESNELYKAAAMNALSQHRLLPSPLQAIRF